MIRVILLCLALAAGPAALATNGDGLLVRFEDDVSAQAIDDIVGQLGGEVVNTMLSGRLVHVRVPPTENQADMMAAFTATAGVRYVEPVQIVTTQSGSGSGSTGTE